MVIHFRGNLHSVNNIENVDAMCLVHMVLH